MKLAIFILFSVLCQHANARGTMYEVTGKPEPSVTCPPGYFGKPPSCSCFEDNTAYFGNNAKFGLDNLQPSRLACQKSCMDHPKCEFWTWGKGTPVGPCYLKHTRDNVTPGLDRYISGSKQCPLPEVTGKPKPSVTCPLGYFGKPPSCSCFEDNTAYFGNNAKFGFDNLQPSRLACQKS